MPKLRFNGFTDDWEQWKLGEITGRTYGGGTPKTDVDEYWEGNIPWIQSSNLTEHQLFDVDIQKHVTEKGLQKSATQLVPENSIAVVSHVGVGKLVYMPFQYTTSQDFISLAELKTEPKFTSYAIYKRLQKDMHIVQGSAIKGITKDDLLNKEISVPVYEEQEAIGKYFSNLDNLIALHQRKCDELKKVKKYMLQKMFPKKGEKVPEIRFAGFTSDWEQRKLGDITKEKLSNGVINNQSDEPTQIRHINVINMYAPDRIHIEDLTYSNYGDFELKKCNVEYGDIFMTRSSLKPEGIAEANVLLDSGEFVYDDHLIRLKVDKTFYDPMFVKIKLGNQMIKSQFIQKSKTTAFTTIGQDDIASCEGRFPSIEEQQRIGSYFMRFDNLIAVHEHKHDNLKEIKKYMLQNMFPKK